MHAELASDAIPELARRDVEVWNAPGDAERRMAVERLWAPHATHHLRMRTVHGHDALEERVATAYRTNVAGKGFRFRLQGQPHAVQDGVLLHWDMVGPDGHAREAFGAAFLRVGGDGRVVADHQFVLPTPAP